MAYIPPGAIKAYMNIKSIVNECFSDRSRKPYVTVSKLNGTVTVVIRRGEGKPIAHSAPIQDVGYLEEVYSILYQMSHRRK